MNSEVEILQKIPSIRLLQHVGWRDAKWNGTTFRWHPQSSGPPIMGLVFENADAGRAIFRQWVDACGNADPDELLREGPNRDAHSF
jgi:hypothetical protein